MVDIKKVGKLKGQSTMEYAGSILFVAAALIMMQFFVMRAISGRIRVAGDGIGEQHSVLFTESDFTEKSSSTTKIVPYMYPLTDQNNKALLDSSGVKIFGLDVDYGVDEKRSKKGVEEISGY
ncbi:MAG: hypothetical protein KAJ14_15660 [Candidatus Omnitrophica bacterium]|nr:hypothetical protein [Candidatus Omnitrophota bacterium]MCK5287796.1 hypothetical protein [Candidatus Omnitrophota bacterium]MCK5392715.1 hypothetical protein [Candidatus Omnitrophota bacterium]MCK5494545.1 hypothetical protein [Candidatus Omnitrophota bacterium]